MNILWSIIAIFLIINLVLTTVNSPVETFKFIKVYFGNVIVSGKWCWDTGASIFNGIAHAKASTNQTG